MALTGNIGYNDRDTLAQGLATVEQSMNEALKAEKTVKQYRLAAEIELGELQIKNIKDRQFLEQQIYNKAAVSQTRQIARENKRYLANKEKLLKLENKLSKAEYAKRLEEEEKLHEKHLEKIKKITERSERAKAGKEKTDKLASELLNIKDSDKLNQLTTGLKNAFTSQTKEGNNQLDILQGLQTLTTALSDYTKQLDNSIENIAAKKGIIDTNLQGSRRATSGKFLGYGGSYWDELDKTLTGAVGVSPLVKREDVVNNLQAMVSRGVSFDVEQRAFLETIKDKIATTFDANNAALSRLIRLQQQDTTAARLGMESALTSFLNNMYETSEYMHEVANSIKNTLEEAESLMGSQSAAAFEYEVQKWMGSMYSVGMSQNSVNGIANALGQIMSGQISGITNGGAGNLVIMAANKAGYSVSDMLTTGFGDAADTKTNLLLDAMVGYLADIYEETHDNNVVQQQLASVYGLTASDLKAAANLNKSRSAVRNNDLNYNGMIQQLQNMADSMYNRSSVGELLNNAWSNFQYTTAAGIANNPALYGIYKIANLLESTVGGVDIPLPLVMGTGVNMGLNIADLMRVGALSGSILSGIGQIIGAGSNGGLTGTGMLKALGIGTNLNTVTRGTGTGLLSTRGSSVSDSGYVGNASGGDVYNQTMTSATDDTNKTVAEAQDSSDEITITNVNENVVSIYRLLQSVVDGTSAFRVNMGNEFTWNRG